MSLTLAPAATCPLFNVCSSFGPAAGPQKVESQPLLVASCHVQPQSALRMLNLGSLEASAETESTPLEAVDDLETGTLAQDLEKLEKSYDEINVKTMFDMREDIGDQKLFFLTNRQAELLAESDTTIDRLLGALEMRAEPKLLINLMAEWGFTAANRCWTSAENWGREIGMEHNRGPFATKQEDNETIAKLERCTPPRLTTLEHLPPPARAMTPAACHITDSHTGAPQSCSRSSSRSRSAPMLWSSYRGCSIAHCPPRSPACSNSASPSMPEAARPFRCLRLSRRVISAQFTMTPPTNTPDDSGAPCFSHARQVFCAVVANPSEDAHWRTILSGSKKWKKRHKFLESGVRQHLDEQRFDNWLSKQTEPQRKERAERENGLDYKKIWRLREEEMKNQHEWKSCPISIQLFDLNKEAPSLIIVDSISSSFQGSVCTADDVWHTKPLVALMNALTKRVASVLPAISLQTGGSVFEHIGTDIMGSLFRSVDMASNSIPVLFLDVVERSLHSQSSSRRMLIELAKKEYIEHQEHLLTFGVVDSFNHCALAHFFEVLFGESNGNARTSEQRATSSGRGEPVPLHVALGRQKRRANRRGGAEDEGGEAAGDLLSLDPASAEEVSELCKWLVRTQFDFVMRFRRMKIPEEHIPHRADVTRFQRMIQRKTLPEEEKGGRQIRAEYECDPSKPGYREDTLPEIYGEIMQAQELACRTLLLDSYFNACNVADIKGAKRLVNMLCLTSRLPSENSVEALELLQRAWNQHDVAMHLAYFYKRLGHLLYLLYILVGQATIAVTAVFLALGSCDDADPIAMQYTLFALSMAGSVLLVADRFFNPTQRGGQLRAGAAQLESIVWRFRTRIGQFAVPQGDAVVPKGPDYSLRDSMTNWHEDLTAGTDLLSTALDKKYPPKVYRHGQLSSTPTALRALGSSRRAAAAEQSKAADIKKLDLKLEKLRAEYFSEYMGQDATKQIPPALAAILAKDPVTRKNMEAAAARRVPSATASIAQDLPGTAADVALGGALPSSAGAAAADAVPQQLSAEIQAFNEKAEAFTKILTQRNVLSEDTRAADDGQHIDDFHSPVEPEQYIALRLDRMIAFYQKKIPLFYNWRRFWELVLALCTVASATLSFLSEYTAYVAIATSLAAGVTSWNARDDLAKRISRYTNAVRSPPRLQHPPGRADPARRHSILITSSHTPRALLQVRSIERLQWWWKSLDDIERASTTNISRLVESGEAIISAERLAWLTAFKKDQKENAGGVDDEAEAKPTSFKRGGMSSVLGST